MSDLLVVVPDRTWQLVLEAILSRHRSLAIREITYTIAPVPGRDPGVRVAGAKWAAGLSRLHGRAILILDHEGCGDARPAPEIEDDLRAALRSHWADRGDAVVVEPELEAWLWRALTHMGQLLDISPEEILGYLRTSGFLAEGEEKPQRPKEAFRAVIGRAGGRFSPSLHAQIARKASLDPRGCRCGSYARFVQLLRSWFPRASADAGAPS